MNTLGHRRAGAILACILILHFGQGIRAAGIAGDDAAKQATGPDQKELDQRIYKTLRSATNYGADLYNSGDVAGCYRLWEGALIMLRPMLDHHPELQKSIDDGLAKAEQHPLISRRAFLLRASINDILKATKPAVPAQPKPSEPSHPLPSSPLQAKSLWDRLGGQQGVAQVVDDFVAKAAKDPLVNFDRNGKYKLKPEAVAHMKKQLIDFISQATGGPLKYTGKSMKELHQGMGISNAEFDAAAADLRQALAQNKVAAEDAEALLKIVETTRKDIVEPKKPVEKTDKDKKSEEKTKDKKKLKSH